MTRETEDKIVLVLEQHQKLIKSLSTTTMAENTMVTTLLEQMAVRILALETQVRRLTRAHVDDT
jgi:hypothetical protein